MKPSDDSDPSSRPRREFLRAISGAAAAAAIGLSASRARADAGADLDALVRAAKAEGSLTHYSGQTENINRILTAAFVKAYGIETKDLRLDSSPLLQRFSSEAESGVFFADAMIVAGGAEPFAEMGEGKGWIEPISKAGLPILEDGTFPAAMNRGRTAIISISPWLVAYNTDKVKPADLPKSWDEIFSPKWKGQVLCSDPAGSDAHCEFWAVLLDHYGEPFFDKVRATMHVSGTIVEETNGLAAGEGALQVPVTMSLVQAVKTKGGPIEPLAIGPTTGVQLQVMLTSRAKAKHPAAGRLFANFAMSRVGNAAFNDMPGGFTVYDQGELPKEYEPPKPGIAARRDKIRHLLGYI